MDRCKALLLNFYYFYYYFILKFKSNLETHFTFSYFIFHCLFNFLLRVKILSVFC